MTKEYDGVLSLGDGLRPGGIPDATDYVQIQELHVLGKLVKKARENDVQVIVEGPGHVPINEIEKNIKLAKDITNNAPFYVLGPLTTDIAPGYDHIVGAIGGAIAAYHGADFLCYVTPAEHLALPNIKDVIEGTIASKIAAHTVNLTRFKDEFELDDNMSRARADLDWDNQIKFAMDKEKFKNIRESRKSSDLSTCSMCGDLCAIDMLKKSMSEKK